MAYMHADTKPKVGYRPYLQTNPRRASQLSGMQNILGLGELGQNHPFDPWRLHGVRQHAELRGLGQMRPFDQNPGGWTLHGLGLLIDTGGYDPLIDPETGNLWADEGYAVDANGNLVVDASGQPVLAGALAEAVARAAANAPGGQQSAEVPSGAHLLYTASWSAGLSNVFTSGDGAIGKLQSLLPQHGMAVLPGSQTTSGGPIHYSIQVPVIDNVGHALTSDAWGVLDSLMKQIVGAITGSNLSVVSAPGTPRGSGGQPQPAGDPITWLEENWMMLAFAAGALIVAGPASRGLFGGRRR